MRFGSVAPQRQMSGNSFTKYYPIFLDSRAIFIVYCLDDYERRRQGQRLELDKESNNNAHKLFRTRTYGSADSKRLKVL